MTPTIDYAKLGLRIKETRIQRKLTQDNLAQAVDCNVSHISNIENNHTKVSLITLLAIANALNTTVDYLLADQYRSPTSALDNEILKALEHCDLQKKERILKMIELL
ncbi:MAG: helix-turn-helix transcriptional regulator [Lachnospiraceae bacterium]|nr:helix-turn-helix transcriptional regulator [Lachnospiraceae bacterium]